MNILNWLTNRKKNITEAGGTQINKNNYKDFLVKAVGLVSGSTSRGDLQGPEYDLTDIKKASEADSYIKMALMKYSYMIYKAGYVLKGNNDSAIEYLNTRFRIMSFSTGKPMDILFQEIADDLVKYSNAFLIKSRVDKIMQGVNAKGVYSDKPIGGYFRVPPTSMQIQRDANGTVKKYQQTDDSGTSKSFNPIDVIHFYLDKDPNNSFGTPRIVAALEDVKLLRRIEGNVISLVYRFSIPIYQWKIGKPEVGFQASDQEIKDAQNEIENMPLDGVLVTNEKTEILAIGAQGTALDASKYLAYFEQRVFSALGVSNSQMGRGGTKQDADSMESQVHDVVKHIQRVMAIFIENYVLDELLLEGGFNPIVNEDDIVHYYFNEISLDTKVKIENHEMLKFQSNVITFDEVRTDLGLKGEADESRLYSKMIETQSAIDQIDAKSSADQELAKTNAANASKVTNVAASKNGGNGKQKSSKPSGAVTNNNRPTNQHGTTSANIKSSYEDGGLDIEESLDVKESSTRKINKHKNNFINVYKTYENLCNDIIETNVDLDIIFSMAKSSIMKDISFSIKSTSFDGMNKAVKDINSMQSMYKYLPNTDLTLSIFEEEADKTIDGILKDIKSKITKNRDKIYVSSVFDTYEYRMRFLLEYIIPKVFWYSYIKTGAALDIEKAYIKFKGSDDNKEHPSEIDTKHFSIDDIPAYHAFCDCEVSFKAGDKKNGKNV